MATCVGGSVVAAVTGAVSVVITKVHVYNNKISSVRKKEETYLG